jgi:hypothetical protein
VLDWILRVLLAQADCVGNQHISWARPCMWLC